MHRLTLQPTLESLPGLFSLCDDLRLGPRIMLVLEEAFVNVASYSGASRVELTCTPIDDAGGWRFLIEDNGIPFDPTAHSTEPTADPCRRGGNGIPLIRAMADSIGYRRDGDRNILTIIMSTNPKT